ncbi:MAG: hypothetical protein JST14_17265 [Bacteroidetes bacterium]|nr:hypothetical protein [Bacteroidota bacterium]
MMSAELRWFYRDGSALNEVNQWLEKLNGAKLLPEVPREDFYRITRAEDISVKFRKYNTSDLQRTHLECKMLESAEAIVTPFNGKIEQYSKWSFEIANDLLPDAKNKNWLKVAKRRTLVKVDLISGTPVISGSEQLLLKEGCNVEITLLPSNGDQWTFGMEAYSDSGNQMGNLRRTLIWIGETLGYTPALGKFFFIGGYAEWLASFLRAK